MSPKLLHTNVTTFILLLTTLFLFTTQTLAANPALEDIIDNPPPFYPKRVASNKRSALDGRDDIATMGKCSGCKDKMRGCTAVSLPWYRKERRKRTGDGINESVDLSRRPPCMLFEVWVSDQ